MILTKRALAFILITYFLTFVVAFIAAVFSGYDPAKAQISPPISFCLAIIIASAVFSAVATYFFFTYKSPKIKVTAVNGLKFGITMIVVGFILDLVLFLPYIFFQGISEAATQYKEWYVYSTYVAVLLVTTVTAYYLEKKS